MRDSAPEPGSCPFPPLGITGRRLTRKKVARAQLYASSLGALELYLNGERIGDSLLAPGWSDYQARANT